MPQGPDPLDAIIQRYRTNQYLDSSNSLDTIINQYRQQYEQDFGEEASAWERGREHVAGGLAGLGLSAETTMAGLEKVAEAAPAVPPGMPGFGGAQTVAGAYRLARRGVRRLQGVGSSEEALQALSGVAEQSPWVAMAGQLAGDIAQIGLGGALMPQTTLMLRALTSLPFSAVQSLGSQEYGSPTEGLVRLYEQFGDNDEVKAGLRGIADDTLSRGAFDMAIDFFAGRIFEGVVQTVKNTRALSRAGRPIGESVQAQAARAAGIDVEEVPSRVTGAVTSAFTTPRERAARAITEGTGEIKGLRAARASAAEEALPEEEVVTRRAEALRRLRETEERIGRRAGALEGTRVGRPAGEVTPEEFAEYQRGIREAFEPARPERSDIEQARFDREVEEAAGALQGFSTARRAAAQRAPGRVVGRIGAARIVTEDTFEKYGVVEMKVRTADGKELSVDVTSDRPDVLGIDWIGTEKGAGTIGAQNIREVRDALAEKFPEKNWVMGERISGVHFDRPGVEGAVVAVPLRRRARPIVVQVAGPEDVIEAKVTALQAITADDVAVASAKNGGATFNVRTGADRVGEDVWAVSPHKDREAFINRGRDEPPTREEVADYIRENQDLLDDAVKRGKVDVIVPGERGHIGTWFDEENGRWVLDVSEVTPSKRLALTIAKKANQDAIINLKTFEEVRVDGEDVRMVPISELEFLRERMTKPSRALVASVRREGIRDPIRVAIDEETGRAVVTDGSHRLNAARKAGLTEVPVVRERGGVSEQVGAPTEPGLVARLRSERGVADVGGEAKMIANLRRAFQQDPSTHRYMVVQQDGTPFPFKDKHGRNIPVLYFKRPAADKWAESLGGKVIDFSEPGPRGLGERGAAALTSESPEIRIIARLEDEGGRMTAARFRQWAKEIGVEPTTKLREKVVKTLTTMLKKAEGGELASVKTLDDLWKGGQAGMAWYDTAVEDFQRLFGNDAELFLKFLAVTSQDARFGLKVRGLDNIDMFRRAVAEYKAGVPFGSTRKYRYGTIVQNLNRVAQGQDPTGQKILPFMRALLGDENAVVVDRWMMRAFGFKNNSPTPAQLRLIERQVRKQAARAGVTPRQWQAGVWEGAIRRAGEFEFADPDLLFKGKPFPGPVVESRMERAGGMVEWLRSEKGVADIGDAANQARERLLKFRQPAEITPDYGWMFPDGRIIAVARGRAEGHGTLASIALRKSDVDPDLIPPRATLADIKNFQAGGNVRYSNVTNFPAPGKREFAIDASRPLTAAQMRRISKIVRDEPTRVVAEFFNEGAGRRIEINEDAVSRAHAMRLIRDAHRRAYGEFGAARFGAELKAQEGLIHGGVLTPIVGAGIGATGGAVAGEKTGIGAPAGAIIGGLAGAGLGAVAPRAIHRAVRGVARPRRAPRPPRPVGPEPKGPSEIPRAQQRLKRQVPAPHERPRGTTVGAKQAVKLDKFGVDQRTQSKISLEVKKLVNKGEVRARRVTHAERQRIAAQLGIREIERAVINDQIDGTTMLAMRNVYNSNEDALKGLYREWHDLAEGKGNELDRVRVVMNMESLEEMNRQILKAFIPAASDMGRNLNALRIIAKRGMTGENMFAWTVRLQKMAGRDLLPEEVTQLRAILDSADPDPKKVEALQALMQQVAPPETVARTLLDFRRAGFLTGLRTQARNFLSNAGEFAFRFVDDPSGWVADRIVSHWTGQQTRAVLGLGTRLRASRMGARRGVKFMRELLSGARSLDPGELRKLDIRPGMFRKSRFADGYIKWIFRAQGAVDQPWRQAAFMESVWEQAAVAAKGNKQLMEEIVNRSVKAFDDGIPDHIALQAMIDAEEAVFQNVSGFGRLVTGAKQTLRVHGARGGVRGNISKLGGYVLEYVVPFSNTPGAVISRVIERTPYGMVSSISGLYKLAKNAANMDPRLLMNLQRQYTKEFGRSVTGMMALSIGAMLAYKGVMSGRWPTDTKTARNWIQAGKSEDSILLDLGAGPKWMKLSGISPAGNLLAIGAQLVLDANNPDYEITDKLLAKPVLTLVRTVKEQSFLRGISEALEVLDKEKDTRYFPRQPGSFVPIAVKDFANLLDPRVREVTNWWEGVQSSIPHWSFQVPAKLDEFGRIKINERNKWVRLIDPFNSQGIRDDKIIRELDRVNTTVPRLRREAGESRAAYRSRVRRVGREREKAMQELMRVPQYRALSREQQADVIGIIFSDVRRQALDQPLPTYRRFIGRAIQRVRGRR
jgi:hypothetical protein